MSITPDPVPLVYAAIAAVQAELAHIGISKGRENKAQGYSFRGIDDVYNALAPILAKHRLCFLPRMISREMVEKVSVSNKALFYVTVQAEFDLVAAEDGSKHTIGTFGEAMDAGDKATNKAMSAAYKYAAMQCFAIPTEGDNDSESQTHDVQSTLRPTGAEITTAKKAEADQIDAEKLAAQEKSECETIFKFIGDNFTKDAASLGWNAPGANTWSGRLKTLTAVRDACASCITALGDRGHEAIEHAVGFKPPAKDAVPAWAKDAFSRLTSTATLKPASQVTP